MYALNKKYLRGKGGAMVVFGIKGGKESGRKFIDALQALLAPGQRRRRQEPGHPPGHDDPLAARRAPAARGGDHARAGPAERRHRAHRRHPRRPGPGPAATASERVRPSRHRRSRARLPELRMTVTPDHPGFMSHSLGKTADAVLRVPRPGESAGPAGRPPAPPVHPGVRDVRPDERRQVERHPPLPRHDRQPARGRHQHRRARAWTAAGPRKCTRGGGTASSARARPSTPASSASSARTTWAAATARPGRRRSTRRRARTGGRRSRSCG